MKVYRHRVRYHEVDLQGFLFNARYLELADVAMAEYFRALGWPYPDLLAAGVDPSVVSASLAFNKPACFEDMVEVDVCCPRVGSSSFDLTMEMVRGSELLAEVAVVYVNVEAASATSRPLPEPVVTALRAESARKDAGPGRDD